MIYLNSRQSRTPPPTPSWCASRICNLDDIYDGWWSAGMKKLHATLFYSAGSFRSSLSDPSSSFVVMWHEPLAPFFIAIVTETKQCRRLCCIDICISWDSDNSQVSWCFENSHYIPFRQTMLWKAIHTYHDACAIKKDSKPSRPWVFRE